MPPKPPHHEPHEPHELHLPPHLVEELRRMKPREIEAALRFARKQSGGKRLVKDVLVGVGVCAIIASTMLAAGISINVVLPATAPIWVGVTTLLYSMKE